MFESLNERNIQSHKSKYFHFELSWEDKIINYSLKMFNWEKMSKVIWKINQFYWFCAIAGETRCITGVYLKKKVWHAKRFIRRIILNLKSVSIMTVICEIVLKVRKVVVFIWKAHYVLNLINVIWDHSLIK